MSKQAPDNVIKITSSRQDQTKEQVVAEALMSMPVQAAMTATSFMQEPFDSCLNELMVELSRQVKAVNRGDLCNVEGLLVSQAYTLDAIYNRLSQWAMTQADINHFATLLKLGLKAQAQSARTLEALATLKNPPNLALVRQANIAGVQQINNGTQAGPLPAGQSPVIDSDSDPQLEHTHGNYLLDPGTATAEIRIDPASQALARIHRPKNT